MKLINPIRKLQNDLEHSIHSEAENASVLQQSRFWANATTWGLIGTAVFGVAWLSLAKTEEVVVAPGKLETIGFVQDIRLPVGGVVDEVLVKEGQQVKAGDTLLQLDSEATESRRQSLLLGIQLKQQELDLKERELANYLELNQTEQQSLQRNLELESEILQRLENLTKEGGIGEIQYLSQRNKVAEIDGRLNQVRVDRMRQQAVLDQAIKQLRGEINDLKSSLSEVQVNIRYQKVTSPVNGIVFGLKPTGPGFAAQTTEPVMQIVPFDNLEARVEVASGDIGFISVGRPTDISIDSFPPLTSGFSRAQCTKSALMQSLPINSIQAADSP